MPAYDMNRCGDLFDRWVDSYKAEQEVIKKVAEYRKAGAPDAALFRALQEGMFESHARSMALYDELQPFRID